MDTTPTGNPPTPPDASMLAEVDAAVASEHFPPRFWAKLATWADKRITHAEKLHDGEAAALRVTLCQFFLTLDTCHAEGHVDATSRRRLRSIAQDLRHMLPS